MLKPRVYKSAIDAQWVIYCPSHIGFNRYRGAWRDALAVANVHASLAHTRG